MTGEAEEGVYTSAGITLGGTALPESGAQYNWTLKFDTTDITETTEAPSIVFDTENLARFNASETVKVIVAVGEYTSEELTVKGE